MAVIGIITCQILELEWAYLLAKEPEIERITILEDRYSKPLIAALEKKGLSHVFCIPHMHSFQPEPSDKLQILITVLDLSLHRKKKYLRQAISAMAQQMRVYVDVFILGYGSCGNSLSNPEDLLDVDMPVFFAIDIKGNQVDDCVGLMIGGRENYHQEQCKEAGTFFMTPGWVNHWDKILNPKCCDMNTEMAQRIFKRYKRSLLITTPVMSENEMQQNVSQFNQMFSCQSEVKPGTLKFFEQTWARAKNYAERQVLLNTKKQGD